MSSSGEALFAEDPAAPGPRTRAYATATRHTKRVRFLKRAIVAGCFLGVAGILTVTLFDPFSRLPAGLSVGAVRLNGSRVTLELPKLSGFQKDGKHYDVRAASGVQDVRKPNIVELNDIEARFDTADEATVRLNSARGVYDSSREFINFPGEVQISSTKGLDVRMKRADMDFSAGTVVSDEPVSVVSGASTIDANRLKISDNGRQITFEGDVRSVFRPAPEPGAAEGAK